MVRLFIGVLAPEEVKDKVISMQEKIKKFVDAKFVERENLHISLSFLGEIEESKVNQIIDRLDEICKAHRKFDVEFDQIKFIPSLNYLRVIAFDVKNDELKIISKEIKTGIGGDVKPPHLTLCRIRKIIDKDKLVESATNKEKIIFPVSSICLIKSALSRYGPKYSVIHESMLG